MSNAAAAQSFEVLLNLADGSNLSRAEKTTLSVASAADVAAYLRPGLPDVSLAKRGYTTWQVRSGGRIVGSVQQLSGFSG